jgi:hypothetical protein
MSSHDDGAPFDAKHNKTKTELNYYFRLVSQVYYGDESARSLVIEGTQGDATLRSFKSDPETQNIVALAKIRSIQKKSSISWSRNSPANFSNRILSELFLKKNISIK